MLAELRAMRSNIMRLYKDVSPEVLRHVLPENMTSAANLIQYLAFREGDYRHLQDNLTEAGLSSLRAAESHCLHSINNVINWLNPFEQAPEIPTVTGKQAALIQKAKKCALFKAQDYCPERFIMVTMDAAREEKEDYYSALLTAGMNCARINTGHDSIEAWQKTIFSIRHASVRTGSGCAIYLDLSGPKIRIGAIYDKRGKSRQKLKLVAGKTITIAEKFNPTCSQGHPTIEIGVEGCFHKISVGQKVLFDDGVVSGAVTEIHGSEITVEIARVKGGERKIKRANGIAFPGLSMDIPAVTEDDREALRNMANDIDVVGISFVQKAEDVRSVIEMIESEGWNHLGVVAKIETVSAFNCLPEILLALMEIPRAGVMIARGDLALEVGMERLAEVQEEILWLCEAAMIPVIWATQVLESLTKLGVPTRAEISDAAMAVQAECVMLNKGPYIFDSVTSLAGILSKMRGHHNKKASEMRSLELARRYFSTYEERSRFIS